jgi:hypothetical protein
VTILRGKGKRLSPEEKDQIVKLYTSGYKSISILAKKFGVTEKCIYMLLKKRGIPRRNDRIKPYPSVTIPKDETKLAYFAGILDGEGSLGFVKDETMQTGTRPYVNVTNTSEELIKWIVENFGGRILVRKPPKGHFGKKKCITWRVERTIDIYLLLKKITPFLVVKKDKAIELLNFVETRLREKGMLGYAEELTRL